MSNKGKFKLIAVTDLTKLDSETIIPESDYSLIHGDNFIQFKYHEGESVRRDHEIKPGIWSITPTSAGPQLFETSYSKDNLLEDFINTKNIEDIIDCFFSNVHLYKEFGIEVAKRGILLYGPPGSGKSVAIGQAANKYIADGKTAVVIWPTDAIEAYDIKEFFKGFKYVGVDKLILVAEDLGGISNEGITNKSDSSLLALLDNNEKTFIIPTMIIATTNFPENFAGNLTNRSGRFDDKIRVDCPDASARVELLKFFAKEYATEEALTLIGSNKCDKFPPAHIKESYIRSRLRNKPLHEIITNMINEIQEYEKAFSKSKGLGFVGF